MNKRLLYASLFFLLHPAAAQVVNMPYLLNAVTVPDSRCDNFICQKGFVKSGSTLTRDSLVTNYVFRGKKKNKIEGGELRTITRISDPSEISLVYETQSEAEFNLINEQLNKAGYWLRGKMDGLELYQFRDTEIETKVKTGEDTIYQVTVNRRILPLPRYILYAEDLLAFNSHEQLLYIFGENNIRKDVYYFSENEFSHCSVLFPNSSRQAVFIWEDEINARNLSQVIIGGHLMTEGLMNTVEPIPENAWVLKNGIHAGMSLPELRKLNGADLNFYGGASKFTGKILPSPNGNLDFIKQEIILDCLDCNNLPFDNMTEVSADEAIRNGNRFFVFSIMLSPSI
jgi:hypothetical protein